MKPPEWKYKKDFGVNLKMKEILEKTIEASVAERNRLQKKLEKLQYGG